MSSSRLWAKGAVTMLWIAAAGSESAWPQASEHSAHGAPPARVRVTLSQSLPKLDGNRLKATVMEVNYGPGESSPSHSHPCAVLGYVVEGAIRTRVRGEPEVIYKAGESFYEAPNGIHAVSANASRTEPAKFVAYFVCDHNGPLSVDVPGTKGQ